MFRRIIHKPTALALNRLNVIHNIIKRNFVSPEYKPIYIDKNNNVKKQSSITISHKITKYLNDMIDNKYVKELLDENNRLPLFSIIHFIIMINGIIYAIMTDQPKYILYSGLYPFLIVGIPGLILSHLRNMAKK